MLARGVRGRGIGASILVAGWTLMVSGCGLPVEADYPNEDRSNKGRIVYDSELRKRPNDSIFGDDGFTLFSSDRNKKKVEGGGSGIAVNSYLWRATLDTIAFMPLSSADPFGGVIITDWYSPPETPEERYKMSVYILGRQLRADGVKVAVFRERADGAAGWRTKTVSNATATNLENKILSRARQLRLASEQGR